MSEKKLLEFPPLFLYFLFTSDTELRKERSLVGCSGADNQVKKGNVAPARAPRKKKGFQIGYIGLNDRPQERTIAGRDDPKWK